MLQFLWPAGLCFLAFQVCNKEAFKSGACDSSKVVSGGPALEGLSSGVVSGVPAPIATVSGSFGQCGKDIFPGLYVRLDDPKVLKFINNLTAKVDQIKDTEKSFCPALTSGNACVFPYIHNGQTMVTCTKDNLCPTSLDSGNQPLDWAECGDACPKEKPCGQKAAEFLATDSFSDCDSSMKKFNFAGNNLQPVETKSTAATTSTTTATTSITTIPETPLTTTEKLEPEIEFESNPEIEFERKPETAKATKEEQCVYNCRSGGSCTVKYRASGGGGHTGNVQGFCFSELFGGRCSGTPSACQDCIKVCNGKEGEHIVDVTPKADGSKKLNVVPLIQPGQPDSCMYSCKESKGCSVEILTNKLISGSIKGSCFPPFFGGACSGTPDGCKQCLDVCGSRHGEEFLLPAEKSVSTKPIDELKVDVVPLLPPTESDSCVYTCQPSGVCVVDIISDKTLSGNVKGSCFPPKFGGQCTGIPDGCRSCLDICKNQPDGGRFIVPIGSQNISLVGKLTETPKENKLTCKYSCKTSGACSVRVIASRGFYQGNSLGSCFSPALGGECSGTPEVCDSCIIQCAGKSGETIELPANVV